VIPNFLHSIAAQVRALVASGKALHVTSETADELELVAGLFKEPVRYTVSNAIADRMREVTLADIAWSWLKLSRLVEPPARDGWEPCTEEEKDRAAECAELAVISVALLPRFEGSEPRVLQSHQGTREGARAAWMHIANQLQPNLRPVIKADLGCVAAAMSSTRQRSTVCK